MAAFMTCNLVNDTPFRILFSSPSYFSAGHYDTAPINAGPNTTMTFTVASSSGGVTGGARLGFLTEEHEYGFAIGFSTTTPDEFKAGVVVPDRDAPKSEAPSAEDGCRAATKDGNMVVLEVNGKIIFITATTGRTSQYMSTPHFVWSSLNLRRRDRREVNYSVCNGVGEVMELQYATVRVRDPNAALRTAFCAPLSSNNMLWLSDLNQLLIIDSREPLHSTPANDVAKRGRRELDPNMRFAAVTLLLFSLSSIVLANYDDAPLTRREFDELIFDARDVLEDLGLHARTLHAAALSTLRAFALKSPAKPSPPCFVGAGPIIPWPFFDIGSMLDSPGLYATDAAPESPTAAALKRTHAFLINNYLESSDKPTTEGNVGSPNVSGQAGIDPQDDAGVPDPADYEGIGFSSSVANGYTGSQQYSSYQHEGTEEVRARAAGASFVPFAGYTSVPFDNAFMVSCKVAGFDPSNPSPTNLDYLLRLTTLCGGGVTRPEFRKIMRRCRGCSCFAYVERQAFHQCRGSEMVVEAEGEYGDYDLGKALLSPVSTRGLSQWDLKRVLTCCGACSKIFIEGGISFHICSPASPPRRSQTRQSRAGARRTVHL
ncbi:hypothetical protein NMY22_g4396 [Coprinellus aureogranulatus]|nr:hypothetical protein NMY22_g4396 [Coprinellus aureogranulatus]